MQIDGISRLSLKPGDVLVVKVKRHPFTGAEKLREKILARVPEGVEVMVHSDDLELTVLSLSA